MLTSKLADMRKMYWKICVFAIFALLVIPYTFVLFRRPSNMEAHFDQRLLGNNSLVSDFDLNMIFDPTVTQNDPRLLELTRKTFLVAPSTKPYNFSYEWGRDPGKKEKQTETVMKILKQKRNGFFIESGANNGEVLSSTVVLERDFGWSGLLVEPNPLDYAELLKKNRKTWTSPVCLSIEPFPQKVVFKLLGLGSILEPNMTIMENNENKTIVATCLPIFTLLSALNITTVDYWCLDIEGFELKVLKTVPFDSILIKVLSVEYNHIPEGIDALKEFMKSKGYIFVKRLNGYYIADAVFVHKSLKENVKNLL